MERPIGRKADIARPPYLQAHLKTTPSAHRPKFLKELAKPTQKELQNFSPTL